MRILVPAVLSISALTLGCAGKSKSAKSAEGDMPPSVDCGLVVEALAPQLEGPSVLLIGETTGIEEPRIAGDLACQVAAGGRAVVVAIAPDDHAKADLKARIEAMQAAGLDV